jgi:hypothetical protein
MIITSILILMTSVIGYSLCRITSRTCLNVCGKSIVFSSISEARRFENLLSVGDTESVHRILKALQQKNEIDIIESEREIYVCEHCSASTEHGGNIFRDLLASVHNPLEVLRNLSVTSRLNPDYHADADNETSVSGCKPVALDNLERVTDDLFSSEYDTGELLGNLSMKPGLILVQQTPL